MSRMEHEQSADLLDRERDAYFAKERAFDAECKKRRQELKDEMEKERAEMKAEIDKDKQRHRDEVERRAGCRSAVSAGRAAGRAGPRPVGYSAGPRPGPARRISVRPGPARPVAPRCGPARPGPVARAARPAAREVACQQACCTGVSVYF